MCIQENKAVTALNLGSNSIGVAGATVLAEALKVELWVADVYQENKAVTTLNLGGNSIGVAGATVLAEALKVELWVADVYSGKQSCDHPQLRGQQHRGCWC